MSVKILALLAVALFLAPASSVLAKTYNFSYEFPPGQVAGDFEGFGTIITGSFEGSDDGTSITFASDIKVSLNGVPFPSDLHMYTWSGSAFVPGAGKFAFDGVKNNFIITDCAVLTPTCVNYLFLFVGSGPMGSIYGRVGSDAPVLRPNLGAWDDIGADGARAGVWKIQAASPAPPPSIVTVVEYYNRSLDHYFITWIAGEIAILDAGTTIKGWVRTGRTFNAYPVAQAGTTPVCRYYIPPGKGDSHFFGRGTVECDATGQKNPSFVLEDPQFMQMFLPNAGNCPANTTPIHRVFSNRADANHRYMTDVELLNAMVARKWLAEGDGPDLVVMCAPQ
jgi:hypothetical protein